MALLVLQRQKIERGIEHPSGCSNLLQFFPNVVRLSYHQASDTVAHGSFAFHLLATTDRVHIVDDELLTLADAFIVASPDITL